MSIGKRILQLRKKAGISQEQLARILGTTRQAVSKWESEKSLPDIDFAIKIGAHFQVSMDYLLLGKDASKKPEEHEASESLYAAKISKDPRLLLGCITVTGLLIWILLPVFAYMYCALMQNLGPVYTDPLQYLHEWPLVGIKWIGIICFLCGLGGTIWIAQKKTIIC